MRVYSSLPTAAFAVSVQFATCSFDVNVSGDFTGTFDGAAGLRRFAGDAIAIDLQSRGFINGATGPESFIATAGTGPGGNLSRYLRA